MSNLDDICCVFCKLKLDYIFIRCEECDCTQNQKASLPYICLECFSNGIQNEYHRNNHSYKVINTKQIKTFDDWSVYEELEVMSNLNNNKIISFKRFNYSDVVYDDSGHQFNAPKTNNNHDWIKHLEKWFDLFRDYTTKHTEWNVYENRIKNTIINLKSSNQNANNLVFGSKIMNTTSLLNLIRPCIDSKQYRNLSGYKPARGDFETEYNDKFEFKYLADLDFEYSNEVMVEKNFSDEEIDIEGDSIDVDMDEDFKIENELKLCILKAYNDLIRERLEKKSLIRSFGMLCDFSQNEFALNMSKNKPMEYIKKLDKHSLYVDNFYHLKQAGEKIVSFPVKFQRLFKNYESYSQFLELINYQAFLKKKLDDFVEYRSNGIRKFRNISIYKNLKFKRLNKVSSVHMASLMTSINRFDDSDKITKSQCLEWFKKFVISEKNILDKKNPNVLTTGRQISNSPSAYPASHMKYKNNPLKIENYPDSDKLDEEEKEFCRVARVQPSIYLRVKAILIMENNKSGFCTYSKARKIAGIDVNKTRLIHNLLLKLELIRSNLPNEIENIVIES